MSRNGAGSPWAGSVFTHLAGIACLLLFAPAPAFGQADRTVPRELYFRSFVPLHTGEYQSALRGFREAAREGVRSTEGRWIDSICYHAMVGECYYRMGDHAQALEQFDSAIKLFLAHKDWMLRVDFPDMISPSASAALATITWGRPTRNVRLGHFPERMLSFQGRLDNEQVIRQGGVVTPPMLFPIRVQEIVRATAHALRRKRELMGPASPHDNLSRAALEALGRRPAPVNHWSQAWVAVQLGMAYAANGKPVEAVGELRNGLLVAGAYDHPLTAVALLELGRIAFEQEQFDAAATYFLEATYAAVPDLQADVMEEAFRYGLVTHLVSNKKGAYAPLLSAAAWARTKRLYHLQVSLLTLAAEDFAVRGETTRARSLIEEARRAMGRRDMAQYDMGARLNYAAALVEFQRGDLGAGETALANAMTFMRTGSLRLFRMAMVDRLYLAGALTDRTAEELYASTLREPTPTDWSIEPMETLATVITPRAGPMERWFEAALKQRQHEKALEIADRIRRHRFYSTLPLGGRLLALRWILEAPEEALSERARLERGDLLVRYPKYAELSRAAANVQEEISRLPVEAISETSAPEHRKLFEDLARLSAAKEVLLREIAVRREPSEFVFPPLRTVKEIQASMTPNQLALVFFATQRYVYLFFFTHDRYAHRMLEEPAKVQRLVGQMLQDMGHFKRDMPLDSRQLADESWKKPAAELLELMFKNPAPDFWEKYDELILVPDGPMWYVPFEALQAPRGDAMVPLISKLRIRYLPLASMIVPDERGWPPVKRTAVILGKLFPQNDDQMALEAMEEFRLAVPDSFAVQAAGRVPTSLLSTQWDRLVVLDDFAEPSRSPYDWSPGRVDRGRAGSALSAWMALPWRHPEQVILPGFHTPAEEALKRPGGGDDLFLSLCALMATGARTVLITRWRVGGQTDYDLVREFVQELPHTTAADAWQRSVELARIKPIDPLREPRIRLTGEDPPPAEHPFFWAGYLLSDIRGPRERPPAAAPLPALPP